MVSECLPFIHYRRADKMLEIVSDDKTPLRKHKLAYGKCYRLFSLHCSCVACQDGAPYELPCLGGCYVVS